MIDKPKRPKQPNIQDRQPPRTLQELINRYDLDNTKVYDFLDELVGQLKDAMGNSTVEKVIGTWVDRKLIYRKAIILNQLLGDGVEHRIDLGISNIKSVINLYGAYRFGNTGSMYVPINFYNFYTNQGTYMFVSNISNTGCNITYNSNLPSDLVYIIVEYTKTTD